VSRLSLSEGEVHVWLAEPEAVPDSLLAAYAALLDEGERARHQRFRFERHRRQFLVSHALVRVTLSRYAPVAPEAWSFVASEFGRPEVLADGGARLRFNLSHTDGLVLCAVTVGADVGADVEDSERPGENVGLADHCFAPSEAAALRALPVPLQRERFFTYWTLKEAYLKARGAGLSLPLAHFAFHLTPGEAPRISFDARLPDEPEAWRFVPLRPSARHLGALAVRRPRALPLTVRCWRTVPLAWEEAVAVELPAEP
jgi:4'-phosphopantetheinyl transferase